MRTAPLALLCTLLSTASAHAQPIADELRAFLAGDLAQSQAAAARIVESETAFEDVLAGLRRGRTYSDDAPRGRLLRERSGVGGRRHPYMILVPEDYTPAKRWPVRFDLHGGMGAGEWKALDGAWSSGWREARNQIVIVPAGWWDSMWWEWSQAENFQAILREAKSTWNIDEDRVVLYGSSDGGAALFFQAMRTPDRWAGYSGHVAPPDRLVRGDFRPDGQMHVSNLERQVFHLGYGEKDEKVPLVHLRRYMELFEAAGADLDWYVLPDQGHSLSLPPEREQQLARFLWGRRRDPLPDKLSWATECTDRYARRSWLVIDELEPLADGERVGTVNILPRWGTPIQMHGPTPEPMPWGRVELARSDNRVLATARGVSAFTLLISPDEFDLSKPIVVEVDGVVAHDAVVTPSVATLLKWAAIDDDRTMLFAGEISIHP